MDHDPTSGLPVPHQAGAVVACVGCGGLVADVSGPTHKYIRASPGCWQVYGELVAQWYVDPGQGPARWHHVDAYAVQHPGGAEHDRRQRQSVAIHLIALCRLFEGDQGPHLAGARRGVTSQLVLRHLGLSDWPYLAPPRHLGAVTAVDVHAVPGPARDVRAAAWLEATWNAWADHHPTIRSWAAIVNEGRS